MKRLLPFLMILFVLFACTNVAEKPENLLDKQKMAEILSDVYMHQQPAYQNEIPAVDLNLAEVDAQIIKNHGTNVQDFKKSFEYYVLQPLEYNEILIEVRDILENKLPENERKRRLFEREQAAKIKK